MTTAGRTALIWSDSFRDHATGPHPESPERIAALRAALRAAGMFDDSERLVLEPTPATTEAVLAVHSAQMVDLVRRAAYGGGAWLDPDTFVSPDSYDIARLAAGAACMAVDVVLEGRALRAFALVRPPGHHAEPGRAMGFCLFNNIAVAAEYALDRYGLERVAIVDWDVHHGNGTQAIFWRDPRVFFISTHQFPFYPGSGAARERGDGAGDGYTLNIPLVAGGDDGVYEQVFDELVVPALRAFDPQLIFVSAGFDPHEDDPLAMMQVSTAGFGMLAEKLNAAADELCGGRLVLVLEGGYNLTALGESVVTTIRALDGLTDNDAGGLSNHPSAP